MLSYFFLNEHISSFIESFYLYLISELLFDFGYSSIESVVRKKLESYLSPYVSDEFLSFYGFSLFHEEEFDDETFFMWHRHVDPIDVALFFIGIVGDIFIDDSESLLSSYRPPQEGSYACEKLVWNEWLDHIVISSDVESVSDIVSVAISGYDHDRRLDIFLSEPRYDVHTTSISQRYIYDIEVSIGRRVSKKFLTRMIYHYTISVVFEFFPDFIGKQDFVVYDDYFHIV